MRTRDLARFSGGFVLVLSAMAILWPQLNPHYHAAVVMMTDLLIPRSPEMPGALSGYGTYFNVVVLVALLAATPKLGGTRRLGRICLGIIVLFVLHVLGRALALDAAAQLSQNGYRYPNAWIYAFTSAGSVLWPVIIWGVLTFRAWQACLRTDSTSGTKEISRNPESVVDTSTCLKEASHS